MSFSERQLHCMNAMGLVAWTRDDGPKAPAASRNDEKALLTPEHSGTASTTRNSSTAVTAPANSGISATNDASTSTTVLGPAAMPGAIETVAEWLVEQALVKFHHRGASVNCSGPEQASLLVVCIHTDITSQEAASVQPLNAECTQLLKLMMSAINLSMSDIRLCLVYAGHADRSVSFRDDSPEFIDGICTPHMHGVLLLDPQYSEHASQSESDASLIPTSSLPLWRIPHPDCLLQNPMLKRRAWESLKVLKQALADHSQRA